MNISLDTTIGRDPAHVAALTGERELAIMSIEQGAYYGLNEVATRIWQLIERPQTVASICATLQDEYDIDGASCARDVVACLATLRAEGLVCLVDG
jgi:hypothetical protein